MNFTPFFFLRNFVRSLQNMKIVVILVFTLLCAYCSGDSSHSVCVCWSVNGTSANKPTRDELDLSSLSTSFCCYDFEGTSFLSNNGVARDVGRSSICNIKSGYADQFKKCCSEKWGLQAKCT
jgi:hypothetical protein